MVEGRTAKESRCRWMQAGRIAGTETEGTLCMEGHGVKGLPPKIIQRSAKVGAPGCVNAAGKLGRSDKLWQ